MITKCKNCAKHMHTPKEFCAPECFHSWNFRREDSMTLPKRAPVICDVVRRVDPLYNLQTDPVMHVTYKH